MGLSPGLPLIFLRGGADQCGMKGYSPSAWIRPTTTGPAFFDVCGAVQYDARRQYHTLAFESKFHTVMGSLFVLDWNLLQSL